MSKIINLDIDGKINFSRMLDEIKDLDVTHAVVCYRKQDGDLCYRILGSNHTTFICGMLDRVKIAIHNSEVGLNNIF